MEERKLGEPTGWNDSAYQKYCQRVIKETIPVGYDEFQRYQHLCHQLTKGLYIKGAILGTILLVTSSAVAYGVGRSNRVEPPKTEVVDCTREFNAISSLEKRIDQIYQVTIPQIREENWCVRCDKRKKR